ncbi:MAG: SGNH/GDSL hydrolase family protein [Caldilineae bacterium]|nr:MAG: SGNH/GDSL hydrolase family protein [Caldilineae bacterium]
MLQDPERESMSRKKRAAFAAVGAVLMLIATLVVLELLIRLLNPTKSLYPRWQISDRYGHTLYPGVTMVDEVPGRWRFEYTINELGYRGEPVPISNRYEKKNIVVLGDSHSFGHGVNDGEEYPAVMDRALADSYDVINLAVGGYGLPQEIRRYYEFGQLYRPALVILQFAGNDPEDGFYNRVAEVDNGRFIFRSVRRPESGIKAFLSRSIVQKSQIYNYLRYIVFPLLQRRELAQAYAATEATSGTGGEDARVEAEEAFYNTLLQTFAQDLSQQGVPLIVIATNDGSLDRFPAIRDEILALEAEGLLDYVDVGEWLDDPEAYPPSPEGHPWGKEAHRELGLRLAEYIRAHGY